MLIQNGAGEPKYSNSKCALTFSGSTLWGTVLLVLAQWYTLPGLRAAGRAGLLWLEEGKIWDDLVGSQSHCFAVWSSYLVGR